MKSKAIWHIVTILVSSAVVFISGKTFQILGNQVGYICCLVLGSIFAVLGILFLIGLILNWQEPPRETINRG